MFEANTGMPIFYKFVKCLENTHPGVGFTILMILTFISGPERDKVRLQTYPPQESRKKFGEYQPWDQC
jgi:hypothetical protein